MATTDIDQWLEQLQEQFQHHIGDRNNLTQRFVQFLEECQRREERRSTVEQQFNHCRNEHAEGMTEVARSLIDIRQEFQGRGAMFDQLRRTVTAHFMPNLDNLKTEQENLQVRLLQLTQEHNNASLQGSRASPWHAKSSGTTGRELPGGANPSLLLLSSWI